MLHQITLVTIYTSFRETLHLKSIWLFVKVSQTSRQNVVHQNVIDRKDWHVSYLPAPFTQNVCLFNASNDDVTSTHPPQNDLCQNIFSTLLHHQNVINKRHIICQSCHLALSQRRHLQSGIWQNATMAKEHLAHCPLTWSHLTTKTCKATRSLWTFR